LGGGKRGSLEGKPFSWGGFSEANNNPSTTKKIIQCKRSFLTENSYWGTLVQKGGGASFFPKVFCKPDVLTGKTKKCHGGRAGNAQKQEQQQTPKSGEEDWTVPELGNCRTTTKGRGGGSGGKTSKGQRKGACNPRDLSPKMEGVLQREKYFVWGNREKCFKET